MDPLDLLLKCLYTILLLLCVVSSNVFFTLFRHFQASLPTYKHVLLNILFAHLSILWQCSNMVCASYILTEVVFSVDSHLLSCLLYYIRHFQMIATTMCIVLISLTRLIANFCTSKYLKLNHGKIGQLTSWIFVFVPFVFIFALVRVCNNQNICPTKFDCSYFGLKVFMSVGIFFIFLFNGAIIIKYVFRKDGAFFRSFNNISSTLRNKVEPGTLPATLESSCPTKCVQKVPHHITFTTGFITILLATIGAGFIIQLSIIVSFTSYQSAIAAQIYSLLFTTFIPIFWIWSNNDLWSFSVRRLKKLFLPSL